MRQALPVELLIQRGAPNAEAAGNLYFRNPLAYPLARLHYLFLVEDLGASLVDAAGFGFRDAFGLALANNRAFKLRHRPE